MTGVPLRIAISAADPVRAQGLAALVQEAGHAVADTSGPADVLLLDQDAEPPPPDSAPVVALGDQAAMEAPPGLLSAAPTPTQLDAAFRAVAAGLTVRLPGVPRPGGFAPAPAVAHVLTPREVDILAAIGEGLSNKSVARRLGISQHTVKFHLEAVFDKLDATSRAEAVAKGLKRGLIEL